MKTEHRQTRKAIQYAVQHLTD